MISHFTYVPFFIKQVEELTVFSNKIFDFTNASMNLIWPSRKNLICISIQIMFELASNFQMKPRILGYHIESLTRTHGSRCLLFYFIFWFFPLKWYTRLPCSVICCVFLFFFAILFGTFLSLFLALNSSYFFKSCIMKSSWS